MLVGVGGGLVARFLLFMAGLFRVGLLRIMRRLAVRRLVLELACLGLCVGLL